MKYLGYLTIIILSLLTLSFTQKGNRRKATLTPENCFGHIQWIRTVPYNALMDSTGMITKGGIMSDTDYNPGKVSDHDMWQNRLSGQPIELWRYDEYGDQLEHDKYHTNGKLYNKVIHEYYPNGDVKEVTDSSVYPQMHLITIKAQEYTYKYDESGNLLDSIVCSYYNSTLDYCIKKADVYNEAGKLLEELHFYNDTINPDESILYRYNEKGQLAETDASRRAGSYPSELAPTEKNIFWYDNEGRVIDDATYRFHEGLVKDVKTTFDSTGYRVKTFSYGMHSVLTSAEIKSFFKASNTLQQDTYDGDGFLTNYTVSHLDSANHLLDEGVFHISYHKTMGDDHKYHNTPPGDTVMVHHLINDDNYNVVEDDYFSSSGKTLSHKAYQYTYDSIGNWIEKTEFDDNKPVKIVDRAIGYYKN